MCPSLAHSLTPLDRSDEQKRVNRFCQKRDVTWRVRVHDRKQMIKPSRVCITRHLRVLVVLCRIVSGFAQNAVPRAQRVVGRDSVEGT